MIGKIAPLVQGGSVSRGVLGVHILGGIVGGAAIGLALGTVGAVMRAGSPQIASLLSWALALLIPYTLAVDLRLAPLPRLGTERQTPGTWLCVFGPVGGIFAWGVDLGLCLSTRLPLQTVAIVPAVALLSSNALISVAVMSVYGLARSSLVAATILFSGEKHALACTLLSHRQSEVTRGAAITAAGIALLAFLA